MAVKDFVITPAGGPPVSFMVATGAGGIDDSRGKDNSRQTVVYWVPWADRNIAKILLLGNATLTSSFDSKPYFHRDLPHTIPWEGGNGWLYASTVTKTEHRTQKEQGASGGPTYERAYLSVTYEGLPYEVATDLEAYNSGYATVDESGMRRFVSIVPDYKTRMLLTERGSYEWADLTNPTIGQTPRRVMYSKQPLPLNEIEYTITWHQIPYANIPWTAIEEGCNSSNQYAYGPGNRWGVGKMLFRGLATQPKLGWLPSGVRSADLAYKFTYQKSGVNSFPDPKFGNVLRPVVRPGTPAHYPFEPYDHRLLFRPVVAS